MRRASAAVIAICGLCVACSKADGGRSAASDDGGGSGGSGGTVSTGGSGAVGGDGPADGGGAGAGSVWGGAGGASAPGDANMPRWPSDPPPASCYPACIWEVVKSCITGVDSCKAQQASDGVNVMCDPSTGWRRVFDPTRPDFTDLTVVTRNGAPCYSSYRIGEVVYYVDDRDRRIVAAVTLRGGYFYALCASGGADGIPVSYPDPPQRYSPDQPHCAAWSVPPCEEGTCP